MPHLCKKHIFIFLVFSSFIKILNVFIVLPYFLFPLANSSFVFKILISSLFAYSSFIYIILP